MIRRVLEGWNRYWFAPQEPSQVVPIRVAISLFTVAWLGSFWSDIAVWFGPHGVLSSDLSSKMIAFEELTRWQCWSPLWWTDSAWAYYAWLGVGMGLGLLGAAGVGGRITFLVLVGWLIGWANRLTWLSGLVEPALIALTAYLIIEPGPRLVSSGGRPPGGQSSWTAGTTIRLVQTHWWILLAATLFSQLGSIVWWRGEAAWWLASSQRSNAFSTDMLRDSASLVNGLTHAVILTEMLALWLITTRSARVFGILFGVLASGAIGLVADQVWYALLLAACLLAFWPKAEEKSSA